MQNLHDIRLHAPWANEAIGRGGADAVTQLFERRHVGPAGCAAFAKCRQEAQFAGLDIGHKAIGINARHQLARGHSQHLLGCALVRHVDVLELALAKQFIEHDVRRGAQAVGRYRQFAWLGSGKLQHILKRLKSTVGRYHHAKRNTADLDDRRGVANRIPADFLQVRRAQRGLWQLGKGVTIGSGMLNQGHRQSTACTRAIFDHKALTQISGRDVAEQSKRDVGRAACRPRHDQRNGAGWKRALRAQMPRHTGRNRRGQNASADHAGPPRLASCPNPRCGS